MITEKDNVFYCDCGFSFQRNRSGAHDCADGLRNKLAESEARCAALAAELSAVKDAVIARIKLHEEIRKAGRPPHTDFWHQSIYMADKKVDDALNLTPNHDAFLAEVRAQARNEGINYAASRLAAAFNHGFVDKPLSEVYDVVRMILDTKEELANSTLPAADGLSGEYAEEFLEEFAAQLRKGVQS
ncbi:hypothetical protein [Enterobacter asburiae]|uniref:hypothetical protein n=1 Tax=Enterobacter asburiae TaxID=61645 RepID=UPI002073B076|nr:hypothetical protein [Enterobacter asburiae]